MTNKTTKRALLSSVVALLLCFVMLMGTTMAWFTDSVSNGANKIVSGNLDIELWHSNGGNPTYGFGYYEANAEEVDADTALFLNTDGEPILWEPGAQALETFRIKNEGNLALKYQFYIKAANATKAPSGNDLTDVLQLEVVELAYNEFGTPYTPAGGVSNNDFFNDGYMVEGTLLAGQYVDYHVCLDWVQSAIDNQYNVPGGLSVDFVVELIATQHTYEKDGYNEDKYDENAEYPEVIVVNNAAELKTAVANIADGGIVYMNAGEYVIDSQINIDGKSVSIVGHGDVVVKLSRTGQKAFYIYGDTDPDNRGINVTISNVTIEGNNAKADIWARTYSDSPRCDINLTLDNVTCATVIADNNYSDGTVINVDVMNSQIGKITLDASPFDNNGHVTYTNLTYDAASVIASIMIQDDINDAGLANITINGAVPTARGEQN